MRSKQLLSFSAIEKSLGVVFKNKRLLKTALMHSSAVHRKRRKSNETLEFLGDSVLELVVRHILFRTHPEKREGELSQLKIAYTSEAALYRIGKRLKLGQYLTMDKGEEVTGGRERPVNISCALEALIGAMFLDRGLSYARRFVMREIMKRRPLILRDYKSMLNQLAMKKRQEVSYEVVKESGPPHARQFQVVLLINGKRAARGSGASKKKAEQDAAMSYMKRSRGEKGRRS